VIGHNRVREVGNPWVRMHSECFSIRAIDACIWAALGAPPCGTSLLHVLAAEVN